MANIKELANKLAQAIDSQDIEKIAQIIEEIKKYQYSDTEIERLSLETALDLENYESSGLEDDSKANREVFNKNIKNILLENTSTTAHTELIKMILAGIKK